MNIPLRRLYDSLDSSLARKELLHQLIVARMNGATLGILVGGFIVLALTT